MEQSGYLRIVGALQFLSAILLPSEANPSGLGKASHLFS